MNIKNAGKNEFSSGGSASYKKEFAYFAALRRKPRSIFRESLQHAKASKLYFSGQAILAAKFRVKFGRRANVSSNDTFLKCLRRQYFFLGIAKILFGTKATLCKTLFVLIASSYFFNAAWRQK